MNRFSCSKCMLSFFLIQDFYNDITRKNLKTISDLKSQIKDMNEKQVRLKQSSNERYFCTCQSEMNFGACAGCQSSSNGGYS